MTHSFNDFPNARLGRTRASRPPDFSAGYFLPELGPVSPPRVFMQDARDRAAFFGEGG